MIGTNIFGGLDKKEALLYIQSMEGYLSKLKQAADDKEQGRDYEIPVRESAPPYPRRVALFGYNSGDFDKTVSSLEIRISLLKSKLDN